MTGEITPACIAYSPTLLFTVFIADLSERNQILDRLSTNLFIEMPIRGGYSLCGMVH